LKGEYRQEIDLKEGVIRLVSGFKGGYYMKVAVCLLAKAVWG